MLLSLIKTVRSGLLVACILIVCPPVLAEPVKIIFETDMETDCDDAAALAMLHHYADLGTVELLAVMTNSRSPDSAAGIDAINTYFGRPDLPIGAYKGNAVGRAQTPIYAKINQRADLYPHDIHHRDQVPDAVTLYSELLSEHSQVVIVSTGYLQNIANLLRSEDGAALVTESIDHMVVVGGSVGRFTGEHNLTVRGSAPSARFVLEHFPRPMLFTPAEVGTTVITGRALDDNPKASPVRAAYDIFSRVATNTHAPDGPFGRLEKFGPPLKDGRPSWDQIGVLIGALGLQDMFETVSYGYMYVEDRERGITEWLTDGDYPNHENHIYVTKTMTDSALEDVIRDAMDYDPPTNTASTQQ